MTEIVPLQVHPWPMSDAQLEVLRAAKSSLSTPVKVMPTRAVPGLHARVLALGELPPWVCDAAYVKDVESVDSVAKALDWLLTAPADDQRGFMAFDYMESIFGPGVVETKLDPCHCGQPRKIDGEKSFARCCEFCFEQGCYLTEGICFSD